MWHSQVLGWAQRGPTMLKSGSSWNLVPLPASNTRGGKRGVLKSLGLD